jgi:hypothetical protein
MRNFLRVVALGFSIAACTSEYSSDADLESAKTNGNPIVRDLFAYKREHGRYPASLQEAGISTPTTKLGDFKYELRKEGNSHFVLYVGDYSRNGFVLFWHSGIAPQEWRIEE